MTDYEFTSVRIPARTLGADGKCCGRKPIFYKTRHGNRALPDPHHFCARCDAEYTPEGVQRGNWAWRPDGDGWFSAAYPNGRGVMDLLLRLEADGCDNSETKQGPILERPDPLIAAQVAAEKRHSAMVSLPEEALRALSALRHAWFPLGKTEDYETVRRSLLEAHSK